MTLGEMIKSFFQGITVYGWFGIILILLASVIQISKININPWSWIGKIFNGETNRRVDELAAELAKIRTVCEENDAKAARERILWFGDELIYEPDKLHSKDRWDSVIQYIDEYNEYSRTHPNFKNHITASTTKMIESKYEICRDERKFL